MKPLTLVLALVGLQSFAAEQIVVETQSTSLVFTVGDDQRLYQSYFGQKLASHADYALLPQGKEAYLTHGMEDYFEPALHINHSDGNPSTLLHYVSHTTRPCPGGTETVIRLADPVYADEVAMRFVAYTEEDVFVASTEIAPGGKSPIELEKYASSLLHLHAPKYFLTQYDGDWASELHAHTQQLYFGKKVLDTKLGARATQFTPPFFQLSLDRPATEDAGEVLVGTLAWSGNFRFTFEVDNKGGLRIVSGINPYASQYRLERGETFRTPEFIFTLSQQGMGHASRSLHDWARKHWIHDGMGSAMTILNNWEVTDFKFNEEQIVSLIADAKDLGVDMFLLDDGWFGTKYKRNNARQGLGDWEVNTDKLPGGILRLTREATSHGLKFGLWIEPEMVNPRSELYEKHKDWVITLPNRKEYYSRNQLVLDLCNPKVQDYVFGIVDRLLTLYPDIAYFKWDCNSPITNIYSNYEGRDQSHLYVDYVRGLYAVLERIKAKYPSLPMMMCSSGGGRTDYGGLRYFTEMWVSDNTDPIERLFIQWGSSQVFPAKVQCAHVTSWNKSTSLKFRSNVAMMGKYGFDINLATLTEAEMAYCKQSVTDYNRMKGAIIQGDQYRLVSPYDGNHTSTMYVSKDKSQAVVFAFDIYPRHSEPLFNVRLSGLDANATYSVCEVNREDCSQGEAKAYSGDYLMTVGLPLFSTKRLTSRVYELTRQ